jgi:heat shock protein HslJ
MKRRLHRSHAPVLLVVALATAPAVLLGVGACGGSDSAALDGSSWRLRAWSERALDPAGFTITADFEDGRMGGIAAVNNYGGPYKTGPGDAFSVGPLSSTMMGASGDAGRAEEIYFDLLDSVETYSREGDTLTLYDAEGRESLVFGPAEG